MPSVPDFSDSSKESRCQRGASLGASWLQLRARPDHRDAHGAAHDLPGIAHRGREHAGRARAGVVLGIAFAVVFSSVDDRVHLREHRSKGVAGR